MRQHLPWLLAATLLLAAGASSTNLSDRDLIIRLQGEVTVLQKQIRDLQESFDKSQGASTSTYQRISDNSDQTLKLMASIEDQLKSSQTVQTNNLAGTATRLTKIVDQLSTTDQKFNQINQQLQALREAMNAHQRKLDEDRTRERQERETREKQAETTAPSVNHPDQLYAVAYQQFSQGKYEAAANNFRRYLEAYGQTEAADNALFWLAESLLALGRQADALREYERLIAEYSRGDKVPTALLRKGTLLLQQERRDDGVAVLRNLIATYPTAQEASLATQELTRLGESPQAPMPTRPTTTRPRTGRP